MKIKTRIQLNIILSLVLAGTAGLLLFFAVQAVNEASKMERIAAEGVKGMAELKIITLEYLLHPGARSLMQWQSKYDSLTKRITGNVFKGPDEKIVLDQILQNLKRVKTVFTNLTTGLRKEQRLGKQESATFRALRERLIGELLVKSQATVSLVFHLHQKFHAKLVTTQKRATSLTVVLLLTLTVSIVGISLWIKRSIARPIAKLEEDSLIIGSGNLDYKVGTTAKDEIGQLSRAFDKMTGNLKETTASITELNKEIVERKQAEEALREREERYRSLFVNMLNGLSYCQMLYKDRRPDDFIYLDVNKAFGELTGLRNVVGKRVTEVIPGIKETTPEIFDIYARVAETGSPERFEIDFTPLGIWLNISVHSSQKGYFVAVFENITERKLAEEKIKASLKEKEVLLGEIHHRVKNNMQVISSLLMLQASSAGDERVTDALKECQGRVQTMAFVHETLYSADTLAVIDFRAYISRLASQIFRSHSIGRDRVKLKVDAEDIKLEIKQVTPLGLIVNELISNSLKYAFPENRSGEIAISLRSVEQDIIEFVFGDNGIGIPEDLDWRNTDSLGLKLVFILAEDQLDGTMSLDREKGTRFTVKFRLKENV